MSFCRSLQSDALLDRAGSQDFGSAHQSKCQDTTRRRKNHVLHSSESCQLQHFIPVKSSFVHGASSLDFKEFIWMVETGGWCGHNYTTFECGTRCEEVLAGGIKVFAGGFRFRRCLSPEHTGLVRSVNTHRSGQGLVWSLWLWLLASLSYDVKSG